MEKEKFKHKTQIRVRNYEIDWQGIVHNAVYLLHFEISRIEYFKQLGIDINHDSIQNRFRVVLARNEINYRSPARFDELLDVYTRITFIKNSSFGMEAYMEESKTKRLIAENVNVHVWLNPATNKPVSISDQFRKLVQKFEGNDIEIVWQSYSV